MKPTRKRARMLKQTEPPNRFEPISTSLSERDLDFMDNQEFWLEVMCFAFASSSVLKYRLNALAAKQAKRRQDLQHG